MVSGQLHFPAASTQVKKSDPQRTGGWVGPRSFLDVLKKRKKFLALSGTRKPDSQVCSYMDTEKSLAIIFLKSRYSD